MASAGIHVVQMKPISISKNLIDGCKFIKWDDDSCTPVVLKVDKKGFFLYWTEQNGETDFLEISIIRDTRTGKYAKTPKTDGKLKESINIGPQDISLEDKTLTIVYGSDFVNVNFLNFSTYSKEIVQEWTDEIFKIAYSLLALNASVYTFLEKAHTKLCLMADRDRKLPVKNIFRMIANHKDDRKRIEKALEACSLSSSKNETIPLEKFDMLTFFNFYKHLIGRNEVLEIFDRICGTVKCGKKKAMSVEQFVQFLNKEQRDPRLNEILYPYANRSRGLDLIKQYEPDKELAKKGFLSFDGFLLYLMSDDNAVIPSEKYDLNCDMDQPLSHYFINSSHNTYLTGHQLTGKSSVEIYRQCLLGGCRCIELDCWNGRSDDEPIITHGFTVVTEVVLKDVLEAIAESAFKTSHYPVILSFENHCTNKQQLAKMARYCRQIFGENLLTEPLPSNPLKPGVPLPSPNQLFKKIIIKDKKEHKHNRRKNAKNRPTTTTTIMPVPSSNNEHVSKDCEQQQQQQPEVEICNNNDSVDEVRPDNSSDIISTTTVTTTASDQSTNSSHNNNNNNKFQGPSLETNDLEPTAATIMTKTNGGGESFTRSNNNTTITTTINHNDNNNNCSNDNVTRNNSNNNNNNNYSCDTEEPDTDSTSDDDDVNEDQSSIADLSTSNVKDVAIIHQDHRHPYRSEMSELVIYVQPIQFKAFDIAEKRNRSFEVSSFDETQSTGLLKEQPVEFVNYNKRQLSRIYPKGTRVNSSNFLPQVFWNSGCQMVALNFQTLDLGMQLNLGIFEYNGRNGYLLKPDFMRRQDRRFDPFTESTVDGIIAGTVSIKIISGQFLSDKRVGTYVEVEMYGLPADTVRRKRTKIIQNNALNPIYDEEPFVFRKVVLPDLACLRITAFEENGKFIGTRILPFVGLRPGYRHISLRSESLQPLTLPTLFVHITVKDYIPDDLSKWADALANPIACSIWEKHEKQLKAYDDESDETLLSDEYSSLADNKNSNRVTDLILYSGNDSKSTLNDDSVSTNAINSRQTNMIINRQQSQTEMSQHLASTNKTGESSIIKNNMELNGATAQQHLKNPSSKMCSPTHKISTSGLNRQDTLNRKMTSLRIHDQEPIVHEKNALETELAQLEAEPIEKLKQSKNVQKIFTKIERDTQTSNKKFDKLREKMKENYLLEEEKAIQHLEKNRKSSNSLSKSVKKIGSKKQSNVEVKLTESELRMKIQELQKNFSNNVLNSFLDQYKEEFKIFESKYEQICMALDKAIEDSQNAQIQFLKDLHDKDKTSLMKRLDSNHKRDLAKLSENHKEKNELARIKRELQNKFIEQAVNARQRLEELLEKRQLELSEKHKKQREELNEEKKQMFDKKQKECVDKCNKIQTEYNHSNDLFINMFGLSDVNCRELSN